MEQNQKFIRTGNQEKQSFRGHPSNKPDNQANKK